jgi:hypothetical protein
MTHPLETDLAVTECTVMRLEMLADTRPLTKAEEVALKKAKNRAYHLSLDVRDMRRERM